VAPQVAATGRAECKGIASTAVLAGREPIEISDIESAIYGCIFGMTWGARSLGRRRGAEARTKSQPAGGHPHANRCRRKVASDM